MTGLVSVESARLQPRGWADWLLWARVCLEHGSGDKDSLATVVAMLEADRGELLTFALLAARKT